jgi:hypothetical protein
MSYEVGEEIKSSHCPNVSSTIVMLDHRGAILARCACGEQYWHDQGASAHAGHKCGFCSVSFATVEDMYLHQQREHDPDGIMFSEIGLPK